MTYVANLGRQCVRCGQPEHLHRLPLAVRRGTTPVICDRFVRLAPRWLRLLNAALARLWGWRG